MASAGRQKDKGVVMITKKLLTWIGAGLLSAITIPAIGATAKHLSHRTARTHTKHVITAASTHKHVVRHATARKTTRASARLHGHKSSRLASRRLPAISSMHSGHSTRTASAATTHARHATVRASHVTSRAAAVRSHSVRTVSTHAVHHATASHVAASHTGASRTGASSVTPMAIE
jgi:hypothetical protein